MVGAAPARGVPDGAILAARGRSIGVAGGVPHRGGPEAGAAADGGYPEDVVDTVKANARDLRLDENSLGFEEN